MSHGPIILTLTSWVEQRLKAVLEAATKHDFDTAFDVFVASSATIILNGQKVSRAQYSQLLWKEQDHDRSVTVNFKGTVAVPKDSNAAIQSGEVGVFYEARIISRGAPSSTVTASLNLVIDQPTDQHHNVDKRRVTSLSQVSVEISRRGVERND